jgi:hypothetical protein
MKIRHSLVFSYEKRLSHGSKIPNGPSRLQPTFASFLANGYYMLHYPQSQDGVPASFLHFVESLCENRFVEPTASLVALFYLQQVQRYEAINRPASCILEPFSLTRKSARRLSQQLGNLIRNKDAHNLGKNSPISSMVSGMERDTHRLASALLLANKFLHDVPPSIGYWSQVTHVSKPELSQTERHLLRCLEHNVSVTAEQLKEWTSNLVSCMTPSYGGLGPQSVPLGFV